MKPFRTTKGLSIKKPFVSLQTLREIAQTYPTPFYLYVELIRRAETPEDYFATLVWDP